MKATLTEIIQENPFVKTLKLKLDQPMAYKPSQFIMVEQLINNELVKRAYSISNPYTEQPQQTIHISLNHVENGKMSTFLFDCKVNDELEIKGPYGVIEVTKDNPNPLVFICGGTGIAALLPMVEYVKENNKNITLINSTKYENYIVFPERIKNMQDSGVNYILTLTQEKSEEWKGRKGRISKELIQEINPPENTEFYVCGRVEFTKAIVELLNSLNIPKDKIHTERW
jgi:NAD(P)H-flavin reductase